jgi:hypothetical protein
MMIVDRLPFADRPRLTSVQSEPGDMYRNQNVVWISIDDVSRPLPAILDTGHGHNLSIGDDQLRRLSGASLKWTGASLKRSGELEIGHQRVVQYAADLRVHRNVPGQGAQRNLPNGIHYLFSFPRFFHQEEMSSISSRYSVFNCRIAFATADSYCLE